MVETIRINVGARVEGNYAPLIENPNGNKRRVRDKAVGTVVSASGQHKWRVVFDFDGSQKDCPSRSLRVVPLETGIPLDELQNGVEDPSAINAFNEEEDGYGREGGN